ncbi:hypothetical protein A3B60_03125 [Candidatus Peregrinibacteria bacterium RIFCSPLOWO2_01_FULL_39_12]|nr:MAG: hypothetical protein A3B60_03125 [Candidatus Peregrinibacteria bacterium RIFCSPLOWO2_01_FULL_39_12]
MPIAGVINIPAQRDTFKGDIYNGSHLNGDQIRVYEGKLGSKKPYADSPWEANNLVTTDEFKSMKGKPRTVGSAVHKLANFASGGYGFSIGANCYIWDFAAALPIIRGAGGDMLIWDEEQWKRYEDIDPSKFDHKHSFPIIAASRENLSLLTKNITFSADKKQEFVSEPSNIPILQSDEKPTDYDPEVLKRFQALTPSICEISRKNILGASVGTVSFKEDQSEQTPADVRIEEELKALLLGEFPDFGFVGEETETQSTKSRYNFVVDPIDGTSNYSNGLPIFSTTISLTCDGKPIGGIIYFPKLDMVVFDDDKNTFVNRFNRHGDWRPEEVSIRDDIFDCEDDKIPFGFDSNARSKARYGQEISKILNQPRTFGGATSIIAYTACGKLGGFVLSDAKLFDYAGGVSLVGKAGGQVFVLDEESGEWKEFTDMADILLQNPNEKRFVVGGGPKTVKKILENIHPTPHKKTTG